MENKGQKEGPGTTLQGYCHHMLSLRHYDEQCEYSKQSKAISLKVSDGSDIYQILCLKSFITRTRK